ncbi:peptidase M23 [Oscillospiraceae bacterium]|nr:peptidase M23 [Oscillospiraceae bacterium]BDF74384.1 peptidase M23 [Oscillospiraceae bacterium]
MKPVRRPYRAVLALALAAALLLPTALPALGVTQSEIDALEQEQIEAKARQAEISAKLEAIGDDKEQAMARKALLDQELAAMDRELESIAEQLAYYDGAIAQKEAEHAQAQAREQAQYELFCARVRAMEEDGDVSYWSILFGARDFSDLLDRAMIVGDVMEYDNAVMDRLTAAREELERIRAGLEEQRAAQAAKKAEQEAARQAQAAKVAEARSVLSALSSQEAAAKKLLEQEQADAAKIAAEIAQKQKELEEERRRNNVVLDPGTGYHWPLPGNYRLTSRYGYRTHPITGVANSFHTGLDIAAPKGTSIEAARGGQVLTSGYNGSYGNYVVIDHDGGDSTLYAHMNARSCSEGDIVKQGDVIGYVGMTGSANGYHLHLEIRVGGSRIDPISAYGGLPFTYASSY